MKKKFLLLLVPVLLFSTIKLSAQERMSYADQNLFGIGISLGYYSYGYLGTRSIGVPPLSAYYEKGFHDLITAGPFLGFARWSYNYSFSTVDTKYSWTFINAGVRGSLHLTGLANEVLDLEINEEKIDWYVTLLVGLEFRNFSGDTIFGEDNYANTSNFFIGPSTGVRYYFNDNIAVFAEGGYGAFGALTLGVTLKR